MKTGAGRSFWAGAWHLLTIGDTRHGGAYWGMVTNDIISDHEVRIYRLLSAQPQSWFENNDIARLATVARRTARQYTRRWTDAKLLNEMKRAQRYRHQWAKSKDEYGGKLKEASDRLELYDTAAQSKGSECSPRAVST